MTTTNQPTKKTRKHKTESTADKFIAWVRSNPSLKDLKELHISEESCKKCGFKYSIYFYDFYVREGKKPDLNKLMREAKFRVTVHTDGRAKISIQQHSMENNNIRDLLFDIYQEENPEDMEIINEAFPRLIKKQMEYFVDDVLGTPKKPDPTKEILQWA